jgi:SAM-dependent methyltransferase
MLTKLLLRLLGAGLTLLGRRSLTAFLEQLSIAYSKRVNPAEALRFLFDLDNRLYQLQGRMSVAYGNGVHTKHRHMRYHDFFTDRVKNDERVLDIGCGIGAVAHAVAEKTGSQVVGIDLSVENISKAHELFSHPNISYMVGDALGETPRDFYDVVILSNVLEHLTERVFFLRRIRETNRPQRFLVRVPLFERDWRVPLKRELGIEWFLDSDHETEYTIESFTAEIDEAGLKITHLEIRWGEIWSELCKK